MLLYAKCCLDIVDELVNVSTRFLNYIAFVLITPQTSVTIICGIQPTGVVTMAVKCYITLVTVHS